MGWQGFPDEVTDNKMRAEMLDETIDILTLHYQRKQFDYNGKHYHLKLSLLDEVYYPPKPVQQPRIPIWVPALWPRKKSMQRILKCDGVIVEKLDPDGQPAEVTPTDVSEIKTYVDANRSLTTPFDIVINGKTKGLDNAQRRYKILAWREAGATWWIEELIEEPEEAIIDFIRHGPPLLE